MEAFKNRLVGKSSDLTKETEELPTEKLKGLWINREFRHFLRAFEKIIRKGNKIADYIRDITPVLRLLPEFGYSYDYTVHKLTYTCYSKVWHQPGLHDDEWSVATSFNRYVVNILQCTERMKIFFDDNIRELLKSTSAKIVIAIKEQTLNVEEELRLQFQKQNGPFVAGSFGYKYALQQVAIEFMKNLCIYPLDSEFPAQPGVYCIYYIGKTPLYEGSQVLPSACDPVYVGMSDREKIADRLEEHCRKVKKGKTAAGEHFELSDFVVRFMIVDIQYYARCIKGMLIEYFSPVWNKKTVGFNTNIWNKFHIQNEEETIESVLEKLRIRSESLEYIFGTDDNSSNFSDASWSS